MKSPNRGAGNRGLLNHGGKGDADRTTNSKAFSSNFGEICFPFAPDGFVHTGHKQRKVYGPRAIKGTGPHIRIS